MLPPHPISTLFPYTTLFRSSFDRIDSQRTFTIVNGGDIYLNFLGGFQPTNGATFNLFYDDSTRGYQDPNGGKDRKSTRLNSSHEWISYAVFCLKKKKNNSSL